MENIRLGKSGLWASRLSLGAMGFGDPSWRSWVLDYDLAVALSKFAFDKGIILFDTCDFYSQGESEKILGRILTDIIPRNQVVLATKVGMPMGPGPNNRGYSRKHILSAVDASLKRLNVDYIDLIQSHIWDPATNIEEMVEAFDAVVRSGKALYVGATDMPAWQFYKAIQFARTNNLTAFSTMQNHYNLVWREDEKEIFPLCLEEGIGMLPYSPMGRGFLCGADRLGSNRSTERARTDDWTQKWYGRPTDKAIANRLVELAKGYGQSPAKLALSWVLNRPGVHSPIIGARLNSHINDAISAVEMRLDDEHVAELEKMYVPRMNN
ncbi:MAG: aldo/keto reductase [Planktomarina sp.]|nr:aldo/keto reductase [Planktomarina sp.]